MAWYEKDHPRHPADSPGGKGGEFRSTSGIDKSIADWASRVASRLPGYGPPESSAFGHVGREELRAVARSGVLQSTQEKEFSGGATARTVGQRLRDGRGVVTKIFGGHRHARTDDASLAEYRRQASAEYRAALVAETIGAPVPATIPGPGASIVYMQQVDDAVHGSHNAAQAALHTSDGARLGLLDLLLANTDRHGYNWFMAQDGLPIGIDHGETMKYDEKSQPTDIPGDLVVYSPFASAHYGTTDPNDPPLFRQIGEMPNRRSEAYITLRDANPLHPDDIKLVRKRIEALRKAGLIEAHDKIYMLQVLDALAPHAKGTARLIPDSDWKPRP